MTTKNILLKERVKGDIENSAAKLLENLGLTEPPVRTEILREALSLDRKYYSTSNDGAIRDSIH